MKIISLLLSALIMIQSCIPMVINAEEMNSNNINNESNNNSEIILNENNNDQGDQNSLENNNDQDDEKSLENNVDNEPQEEGDSNVNLDEEVADEEILDEDKESADNEEIKTEEVLDIKDTVYKKNKKTHIAINSKSAEYIPEEVISDINALNDIEYLEPKTETKYEVVISHEDGNYTYFNSSENLDEAMEIANNIERNSSEHSTGDQIPAVINENGQVVYATKSMGRIVKYINGSIDTTNNNTTLVYPTSTSNTKYTYVNHGYIDDVPLIEDNGKRAKIEIGGYTGWVDKDTSYGNYDLTVVPMNQVKNPSYYRNVNGDLVHYISSDVTASTAKGYDVKLGPAPSYLKSGIKYYSYDGNYFYTDLNLLIEDAQNGNHNNSVNKNSEYYNYYLYLPFRSKSSYSANDINNFIINNTESASKLRGTGKAFVEAQNKYGANALVLLGIAMNESAKGMSSIAQNKNNLFGINAVDSSPGQSANYFKTVDDCIDQFARQYISQGYGDPQDWRYHGANLGNKNLGANVQYASDPFWGEKASRYSYHTDKYLSGNNTSNLKDYNKYQLAIYTKESQVKSKDKKLLYNIKSKPQSNAGSIGNPMIITSLTKFSRILGQTREIAPDRTTSVNDGEYGGVYDWNHKAYVDEDGIKLINTGRELSTNSSDVEIGYRAHVGGYGWQSWQYNGETAGVVEQGKRMESIEINLIGTPKGAGIKYRTHVEGIGWMPWQRNGSLAGTEGQSKRIEAIEIELEGLSEEYHVEYRAHVQGLGWMSWMKDGDTAGTIEQSKRLEAIEIRIVKEKVTPNNGKKYNVEYRGHVQGIGWQSWRKNGAMSGTIEQSKRLEGLEIKLLNPESGMRLRYRGHVGGIGWMPWVEEGKLVGTEEQGRRLEAIQIDLIGAPKGYHVEYRTHVEGIGWMPWVNDGKIAGTTEQSKRIEAIEIRIIKY